MTADPALMRAGKVDNLLARLDLERMEGDLRRLSAEEFAGRRIGTDGHERAKEWLLGRFGNLGLDTSTFRFSLPHAVLDVPEPPTLFVAEGEGSNGEPSWCPLEHRVDFAEHPRSAERTTPVSGIARRADAPDLRGAWAILEAVPRGEAFATLAEELEGRGAVGVLSPQRATADGFLLKRVVAGPAATLPVLSVRTNLLSRLEGKLLRVTAPIRTVAPRGVHVLGGLAGADPAFADAPLIVGAHYDGVGDDPGGRRIPCAADNAAGVAVVLEVARVVSESAWRPGRPMLFVAFDAEEVNALGSKALAEHLGALKNSPLVVNLDGAARFNGSVSVEPGPGAKPLLDALDVAGEYLGVPLAMGPVGSDNRRFAAAGFPTVGLGLGGAAGHSPADSPERVDPAAMGVAAALLLATMWTLAHDQIRVPPLNQYPGRI